MTRRWTAVACAALIVSACGSEPAPEPSPSAAARGETHPEEADAIHLTDDMARDLRISTARVATREGAEEVTALGELAVDQARYAEVSAPTGAHVVRVMVETNALVDRGTPLAQLRSADLGRARADLMTAEAHRDLAAQTLDRKRALASERIVAQREVQEAEAALRAAEAERRAAVAALQALAPGEDAPGDDASLLVVRSPIAGRVVARDAVVGQFADPTTPLFTVADLGRVWMIANAFERDAVNIEVGSVAHVTLAAMPGQEFDGRVALVGRQVDPGSRTVPVRIELENGAGALRPGMSATARLEVVGRNETFLVVPSAALQRVGNRWLAFVPSGASEFEMRVVGRGRDLGNQVEVVSGLRADETVVVEGAFLLKAEAEKRSGGADAHAH